jgi:hypothetical protein
VVATLRRGSEHLLGGVDAHLPWRAAAAEDLRFYSFWARGCDGCILSPGRLLRRWARPSSPLLPAGGVGAAGLDRIMATVLVFLSR